MNEGFITLHSLGLCKRTPLLPTIYLHFKGFSCNLLGHNEGPGGSPGPARRCCLPSIVSLKQSRFALFASSCRLPNQLRQAVYTHPDVRRIGDDLEREVHAGTAPAAAAARRILKAFGIPQKDEG